MTESHPCPACGASATDCSRRIYSAELARCCTTCSGNHDTDTYSLYYPTEKGIA